MKAHELTELCRISTNKLKSADMPVFLMKGGKKEECELQFFPTPEGLQVKVIETQALDTDTLKAQVLKQHHLL